MNFAFCVKFQKPPKVGGLTMTEGSEREDKTVDRKHLKWEINHPKWKVHLKKAIIDFDSSFEKGHCSFEKGHTRFEIGHHRFRFFIRKRA